jgi:hypothetical protein
MVWAALMLLKADPKLVFSPVIFAPSNLEAKKAFFWVNKSFYFYFSCLSSFYFYYFFYFYLPIFSILLSYALFEFVLMLLKLEFCIFAAVEVFKVNFFCELSAFMAFAGLIYFLKSSLFIFKGDLFPFYILGECDPMVRLVNPIFLISGFLKWSVS